jgi:hypothetical protein
MCEARSQLVKTLLSLPDVELGKVLTEIKMSGRIGLTPPPPSWEDIAELLELERLTVGTHYIRDEDRYRVASFLIPCWWAIEFLPSFRPGWRLAGATALGNEFRGTRTGDWKKVALATSDDSAVMLLHTDPIVEAINALDLADFESLRFLDGVSYHVTFHTMALRATFEFANPTQESLVALERAVLQLARTVALTSGNERLISHWREE